MPGWATVELDRAEHELRSPAGPSRLAAADRAADDAIDVATDHLLGARARLVGLERDRRVVLLEPSTEGPLAAALARHGEGWLAAYLLAAPGAAARVRGAGHRLSAPGRGPFGVQRRVLVGRRDGPFILLVERD